MREIHTDFVQNRFSAYLVVAVTNRRIRYLAQKNRLQEREYIQMDLWEKNHTDFEVQYHSYLAEQSTAIYEERVCLEELEAYFESKKIMRAVRSLKEREKRILVARVFREMRFSEIGEELGMEPRQAEMAYYYIIRKLRKELGVSKKNE